MKNKLFAIVLSLCLAIAACTGMTACGSKDDKTIVIWSEATSSDKAVLDRFVAYFNEHNDLGYKMEYELKESVTGSLSSASIGGSAPDLVIWPRWETVSRSGLVHDLSAKIAESEVIDLDDYNAAARSELELNGKVYGVPTDLDAWGLWCNMDLMTEEQIPTTWAELKASTVALTSGSGVDQIVGLDAYNLRGQFYELLLSAGGQLVDTTTVPPTVNIDVSDKTSKSYTDAAAVMDLIIDLMRATGCPTDYHTDDKFIEGLVAMKFGPSNYDSTVKSLLGREMNLEFVGCPARSETEGAVSGMLGGFGLAIPKTVKLDKSFPVLEWWLKDENLAEYCRLYNLLPAKTSLQSEAFVEESPVLKTMKAMLPSCNVRPIAKGYTNVEVNWIFGTLDSLREFIRTGTGSIKDTESALRQIKEKGDSQFQLEAFL